MPASTSGHPVLRGRHSSGASTLSGVARMLASTVWYARLGLIGQAGHCSLFTPVGCGVVTRGLHRRWVDVDRITPRASHAALAPMARMPEPQP